MKRLGAKETAVARGDATVVESNVVGHTGWAYSGDVGLSVPASGFWILHENAFADVQGGIFALGCRPVVGVARASGRNLSSIDGTDDVWVCWQVALYTTFEQQFSWAVAILAGGGGVGRCGGGSRPRASCPR